MEGDQLSVGRVDSDFVDKALAEFNGKRRHQWDARETINYGWNFVTLEEGEWEWSDVPEPIAAIRSAVHSVFQTKISEGDKPEAFDNVIVTFYGPGQRIDPHFDRDKNPPSDLQRSFYFGKSILGVVLEADESGRLFFLKGDGKTAPSIDGERIAELAEESGVCFLLQGKLRHAPYYHAVSAIAKQRISITFRVTHKIGNE